MILKVTGFKLYSWGMSSIAKQIYEERYEDDPRVQMFFGGFDSLGDNGLKIINIEQKRKWRWCSPTDIQILFEIKYKIWWKTGFIFKKYNQEIRTIEKWVDEFNIEFIEDYEPIEVDCDE